MPLFMNIGLMRLFYGISSLFQRAIGGQLADSNACAGVERFKIPASPPRVLSFTDEERQMRVAAHAGPYLLPFVTLAPGMWMREMEMLKI